MKKLYYIKLYYIKILFLLLIFLCNHSLNAQQNLKNILDEILLNNQQLKVYENETERLKVESTIGLLPADPQVEFGYLWGYPSSLGNRKDFIITQYFTFPTTYAGKIKFSRLKQSLADKYYQKAKQEIVGEVMRLLVEIIYQNKMLLVLEKKLDDALKIHSMSLKMFEYGEIGMLDKDKADLQLLNIQNAIELCKTDIKNIELRLKFLNGNKIINVDNIAYPDFLLIEDEKDLYSLFMQRDAEYVIRMEELVVQKQQIRLSKNENFPELFIAYASESILDEKLKGVKAGISIPLWHNHNTIKLSKINFSQKENQLIQFIQEQEAKWSRLWINYQTRKSRVEKMDFLLSKIIPNQSLIRAYELGEISLMDFITESSFYYDSQLSFLELEKEMFLTAVEIKTIELTVSK